MTDLGQQERNEKGRAYLHEEQLCTFFLPFFLLEGWTARLSNEDARRAAAAAAAAVAASAVAAVLSSYSKCGWFRLLGTKLPSIRVGSEGEIIGS